MTPKNSANPNGRAMSPCQFLSVSWVEAVTKEIVKDRRPDEENHGNPDKTHIRVAEPAKKDIPQNDEHKTDIDEYAEQADSQEPVELTQFREKHKHHHEAESEADSSNRADFFPGIHGASEVMGCPAAVALAEMHPVSDEKETGKIRHLEKEVNRKPEQGSLQFKKVDGLFLDHSRFLPEGGCFVGWRVEIQQASLHQVVDLDGGN